VNAPQPNLPLLRKAVEWAEAEAAKTDGTCMWNQHDWAATSVDEPECGTSFCIAGYAVVAGIPAATLGPPDDTWGVHPLLVDGQEARWGDEGQRVLGLTDDERYALFDDYNTIERVREVAEQIAARAGERL
jgi:hypothetical protein